MLCVVLVTIVLYICLQHSDADHNVSSPEFKVIAAVTYKKVLPCIERTWMLSNQHIEWTYPDDAQEHYEEILRVTEQFRKISVHEYAGYEGPWIENIFIKKFMSMPLHRFNGLIPIFIQWIDGQILRGRVFNNMLSALNSVLRKNVLYLAISQGDVGLGKIGVAHPNILVMAAGGFGHITIPLVKSEIEVQPQPAEFVNDIAFFGNTRQSCRPAMLGMIQELSSQLNLTYKQGTTSTWMEEMAATKFNLAPRGYGRSSFRFAE